MRRASIHVRNAVVGFLGLAAVAVVQSNVARAATIVPVTQQRSVNSMVIVPPCGPPNAFDNDSAIGFGPFEGKVQASRACDLAHGVASADQQSSIEPASLNASGGASSDVFSVNNTVIHAIPNSIFQVTFTLTAPARYFVAGELSASGGLPIVVSVARLRLTNPANQAFINYQVNPGPGGAPNSLAVQSTGTLAPGQYTLRAEANAWVDAMVPPNGVGEAAYQVSALFQRPGDANIDGSVNVNDLLDVVGAWGPCPPSPATCYADLDADGDVDVNDLLQVVGNWE